MRLSLRQLEIFLAITDHGTTTAAGNSIALSQSATSGALSELEGMLDNKLFDRIGKRLVLNDAGRALLPEARAMLAAAKDIESRFGIAKTGQASRLPIRLRIGASTTIGNYLLPRLVAEFCAADPDAQVDVMIGNTSEVAGAVSRLDVDFGLIEGPCHDAALEARPWIEEELVVVCAPDHPLAALDGTVPLKALREASWLLRESGSGTREAVEQVLLPQLHQLLGTMHFGSTEAIKQAAAAGLGVTCLSRFAVEDLIALDRLVVLKTSLRNLKRRFYLVRHRQKTFSSVVASFISHCDAMEPGLR